MLLMPERIKARIHRFIAKHPNVAGLAAEVITAIPRVDIGKSDRDNLLIAQKWLNGGGGVIFYFAPHTCIYDPAIVGQRLIRPYIKSKDIKHFAWLTSSKFSGAVDGKPSMGLASVASERYASLMGFEMLPIYQPYRLKRESIPIDPSLLEAAQNNNFVSILRARRILQSQGGIVATSPEGTRGTTGGLQRGHEGIQVLIKEKNAIAFPIVLSGVYRMQAKDNEGLVGLNPFIRIRARVGSPINFRRAEEIAKLHKWKNEAEMGDFTIADALMLHLAAVGLDPWMKDKDPLGVYADENIEYL